MLTQHLTSSACCACFADRVVIQIDPADSAQIEFWRGLNPGALAMVEGSGMKPGSPATAFICQVVLELG